MNTQYKKSLRISSQNVIQKYKKQNITLKTNAFIPKYNIFTPPYKSSWFNTEHNLSLELYIKHLFMLSKEHLQCNLNKNTTKAILVPHAGLKYSGLCCASSYYELNNRSTPIKNIILLCTNHFNENIVPISNNTNNANNALNIYGTSYKRIVSYKKDNIQLSIDTKTMELLTPYIKIENTLFKKEHSFFNQLPFIETIAPNALICPLLIGNIIHLSTENQHSLYNIMNILKELLQKKGTVLICSSDLSHINGIFNHKINNYIYQNIRKSDNETLQFFYNIIDGVVSRTNTNDELLFLQNSSTCGIMAIYLFSKLLHLLSINNCSSSSSSSNIECNKYLYSRVSCYYTSLTRQYINLFNFDKLQLSPIIDISDTSLSSVSYIGLVFTTQSNIQYKKNRKLNMLCSNYEKIALICLAREQLYYYLLNKTKNKNKKLVVPNNFIETINSPFFKLNLGIFSTLYKKDILAGCIGTLETENNEYTIEDNVKKYVILSANDKRFERIEFYDFNTLSFSINILYNIIPITVNEYFSNKFKLGYDGILIKKGDKQGYFLPSVATDFNYDKQKLLEELCINKMGDITKECFRANNANLFYNEGIIIKI